jgi:hypothetical protein
VVLLELQTVVVVVPTLCFLAIHLPVVVVAVAMQQEQVLVVVRVVVQVATPVHLLEALETHPRQARLKETMAAQVQARPLPLVLEVAEHLPLVVLIQVVTAVMVAQEPHRQLQGRVSLVQVAVVEVQEQQERPLEMAVQVVAVKVGMRALLLLLVLLIPEAAVVEVMV